MSRHTSAKPSHYDHSADKYDAIYEKYAEINEEVIANLLSKKRLRLY